MPISSFRLKGTIGRNYKTDFDDTLRTKEALRDLEYYDEPSYGMTGYPDEALFGAIEEFQRDHGLQRDGIMKPGGETANAIGEQLPLSANQNSSNGISRDPAVVQVAGAPALVRGAIQTLPLLAPFAKKAGEDLKRWWDAPGLATPEAANSNERTSIIDPFPPLPEPVDPPKIDNKTEFPATPPEIPAIEGAPSEPVPNDPVIFQALSDELRRELQRPLEAHRGNLFTQRNLRRWIDIGLETFQLWSPTASESFEHTAGSYDADGNYRKEDYLKNVETGGRKGSSNADATFKYRFEDETERKLYLNSGRMRKDHETGSTWEEYSFKNLVRNAGREAAALVEKLTPGMDETEWEERARKKWIEIHTRMMGRPPSK